MSLPIFVSVKISVFLPAGKRDGQEVGFLLLMKPFLEPVSKPDSLPLILTSPVLLSSWNLVLVVNTHK